MKDTELKRQRDRDLYASFKTGITGNIFGSAAEAVEFARKSSAPQYYITARTASLLIGKIENKISLFELNSNSRKRIWCLYFAYKEYLKQHPGCRTPRELIMEVIVESAAPEFFVSQEHAKHIILKERKAARKNARR